MVHDGNGSPRKAHGGRADRLREGATSGREAVSSAERRETWPSASPRKAFVLDTNVLLHNPAALFAFKGHEVVIPLTVVEELDKFKKSSDDVGRHAREVIRQLDRLRTVGRLKDGVPWNEDGGRIRVAFYPEEDPGAAATPDDRILRVAVKLREEGWTVVFISKDMNVRLKSDALGLPTEDFEAQKVNFHALYQGYVRLGVAGDLIDTLYRDQWLPVEQLQPYLFEEAADGGWVPVDLFANESVHLTNALQPSQTGLARCSPDGEGLEPIRGVRKPVFGIMPRNLQQTMALDLLLDDAVELVTLHGTAGTGKTLLALAAGLQKMLQEQRYHKLLVARPIMPVGRDLGYLPGTKEAKLGAWMQPIFDNLDYLFSSRTAGEGLSLGPDQEIDRLHNDGQLALESLTYIRGRSIPHQFVVVDEAQNLTPHEVKTIVSRVGEGTKIVLTGDVLQIDNPYLDSSSNGLSYMAERLKGQPRVGHVTLDKSERSALASVAAELL